jgi:hypothetical protein
MENSVKQNIFSKFILSMGAVIIFLGLSAHANPQMGYIPVRCDGNIIHVDLSGNTSHDGEVFYWMVVGSAYFNNADIAVIHFDGDSPCEEGNVIPAKPFFSDPGTNYFCTTKLIDPNNRKFKYHIEAPKCAGPEQEFDFEIVN